MNNSKQTVVAELFVRLSMEECCLYVFMYVLGHLGHY